MMETWQRAFSPGALGSDKALVYRQDISTALSGKPIWQLVKHLGEAMVGTVIEMQLLRFKSLFNFNKNLNKEQVEELANYILAEYTDLSVEGIQHCLNSILKRLPPFDKQLYESLDVQKMLGYLTVYKDYLVVEREALVKNKQMDAMSAGDGFFAAIPQDTEEGRTAKANMIAMAARLKHDITLEKIKAQKAREEQKKAKKEAEVKALISKWTAEYNDIIEPAGTLKEYIEFCAEGYMDSFPSLFKGLKILKNGK